MNYNINIACKEEGLNCFVKCRSTSAQEKGIWECCYGNHPEIFSIYVQYLACLLLGCCKLHDFMQIKELMSLVANTHRLCSRLCLCRVLSDPRWHAGGHTWPALRLEHLQAAPPRESPLHPWHTCRSPLGEGGTLRALRASAAHSLRHSSTTSERVSDRKCERESCTWN